MKKIVKDLLKKNPNKTFKIITPSKDIELTEASWDKFEKSILKKMRANTQSK